MTLPEETKAPPQLTLPLEKDAGKKLVLCVRRRGLLGEDWDKSATSRERKERRVGLEILGPSQWVKPSLQQSPVMFYPAFQPVFRTQVQGCRVMLAGTEESACNVRIRHIFHPCCGFSEEYFVILSSL